MTKGMNMKFFNTILLTAALLIAGSGLPATCAQQQQWNGYLIDHKCAEVYKVSSAAEQLVKEHSRYCDLQDSCNKKGFEIYSDGKWYQLDAQGNQLAKD